MKIELHAHTSEVSGCGKMTADELIRRFAEAGYGAVVVTDHLIGGHFLELTHQQRADRHLTGYHAALEAGKKYGVTVLLGAEVRFPGRLEDILLYGLKESDMVWIVSLLEADLSYQTFHDIVRQRGLVEIQAHPFRPKLKPIPHEYLDGVEVYNGNARHNSHYDLAMFYGSRGGMNFIRTSGSDAHQVEDMARGGVISPTDIHNNEELVAFLKGNPMMERIETLTGFRWQNS